MIGVDVPGVLVVGREASRVGGLGDLAVVDLLEGVEALAGGRQGVHQMHGSGSFGGVEMFGIGTVPSSVIYSSSRVQSFFHMNLGARLAQKKRLAEKRAKILDA